MNGLTIGGADAVRNAQAWSATRRAQAADTAAANADAMAGFRARGFDIKVGDMVDAQKNEVLKATDSNEDGFISQSELAKQLVGKSDDELASIHDAMDANKDGHVSADEYKDSMPAEPIMADTAARFFRMVEDARSHGRLMVGADPVAAGVA